MLRTRRFTIGREARATSVRARIARAALIALTTATAIGAASLASATASASPAPGLLRGCAFQTTANDNGPAIEDVKIAIRNGAGLKGTLTIRGGGLYQAVPFTIKRNGVALMSFGPTASGTIEVVARIPRLGKAMTLRIPFKVTDRAVQAGCSAQASGPTPSGHASTAGLEMCTFQTSADNNGRPVLDVKIVAPGGSGQKGTLAISGPGLNGSVPLAFNDHGIALTSLTPASSGAVAITATLTGKGQRKTLTVPYLTTNHRVQDGCSTG